MFNVLIVAVMAALVAFYSARAPELDRLISHTQSRNLAGDMAVYRQAVVAYFSAHPDRYRAAPAAGLMAPGAPMAQAGEGDFANYRLDDGTIVVYALSPQPGLTGELLALSQRSHMVGHFSGGVFRPALSAGSSTLAAPEVAIPNGGPVWLAAAN